MDPNERDLHRMSQIPTKLNISVLPAQTEKTALIEDYKKKRAALIGKLVHSATTILPPDNWVERYRNEKALLIGINSYTDQIAQYQAAQRSDKHWADTQQQQQQQ